MENRNKEELINLTLSKTNDISQIICELKQNSFSQGETHFILFTKFKHLYTFQEIGDKIVNSHCWQEVLNENISIENDITDCLENED